MADRQAGAGSRKASVGDEGAGAGQPHRLDQTSGHEHLLHTRPAAWALIAHDHDIARLDDAPLDRRRGVVLALEDAGAPAERQEGGVDPGRLYDAAVARQVAAEDGEPTILAVRVRYIADAAFGPIEIERVVVGVLAEGAEAHHARRRGTVELAHLVARRALHVPAGERIRERLAQDVFHGRVEQPGALELTQDAHDAAGSVHVFRVVARRGRRHLAEM